MKKVFTFIFVAILIIANNIIVKAQYCTPTYSYLCSSGDYIDNVYTTGGITNFSNLATGCNGMTNNYISYTSLDSVKVAAGGSFNLNVQPGSSYGQGFGVWIDLNNNSNFTDNGEYVWNSGTYGTSVFTGLITIPANTSPGKHIMRIRCAYTSVPSDPCSTYSYGETEDYSIYVITPPQPPSSVIATPSTINCGGSVNLSAVTADTSIIVRWWDSSIGGNMLGTSESGTNFSVVPIGSTFYFCESFDKTNFVASNSRDSVSVIVNTGTIASPTSVTAIPSVICSGNSSNLNAVSSLGVINWYLSSCSGQFLGTSSSGNNFEVSSSLTTTYWVRAELPCGSSACVSVEITIGNPPAPTNVTASPAIVMCNDSTLLSAISQGYIIKWWDALSGGNLIGISQSGGNLMIFPQFSGQYYAETSSITSGSLTFNYTGAIHTWQVPTGVNSITIDARGASGGYLNGGTAGNGARMVGYFVVSSGQVLSILAGQSPGIYSGYFPGGGGGTFVALGANYSTATPMIVAGGGGGGTSNGAGVDAPISQTGTYTSGGNYLGSNGYGANAAPCVGGGGGFYSSGATDTYFSFPGGGGFQQGGVGACAATSYISTYQCGGFGGGTAADYVGNCNTYGGNGGGYSGGSGYTGNTKYYGEAGGSYNGGTNQQNYSGTSGNTGNGFVIISWSTVPCTSSSRTSVSVTVIPPGPPSLISALPSSTCSGGYSNLSANISAGTVQWFIDSCSGTLFDTSLSGVSVTVFPTIQTTYWARAYSSCGVSSCLSITVSIGIPLLPNNLLASPSTITCGDSSNLSALATGYSISWWDASTGGNFIGTSSNGLFLNIFPSGSTTYYAESDLFDNVSATFNYTGSEQLFTVPNNVNSITIDAYGAQGGNNSYSSGGLGGRMQASINFTSGQVLNLFVGGVASGSSGGWNGGGDGGYSNAGGGGGASDIRIGGSSLNNRVIIAGGGGGAGYNCGTNQENGGSGGGTVGGNGNDCGSNNNYYNGTGGNQTGGGSGANYGGASGTSGFGGSGALGTNGGGGGGGYFGGGGGYYGSGGGGSAWVTNIGASGTVYSSGINSGNGKIIITWNSILCSSTSRSSVSITVYNGSLPPPISVIANPDTVCSGSSVNLFATGITGIIRWWDASIGGNLVGTSEISANFTVTPTGLQTYYAENYAICGISVSRTPINVYVASSSVTADSANASNSVICAAYVTTLKAVGGSLGDGATWKWYSGSCGGLSVGYGDTIYAYPYSSTEYFARAEGKCNTTSCVSIFITVESISVSIGNDTTICSGTITLTASIQNTIPDSYYWWESSNTNQYIGTGQSITVSPTSTSSYYVNITYSYPCSGSLQSNTRTINVDTIVPVPSLVNCSPANICPGDSSLLWANCTMGTIRWWTAQTGGTLIATTISGDSILVYPTITTTYYAEAYAPCDTSLRVPMTVTVNTNSTSAVSVFTPQTFFCSGSSDTLIAIGGSLGIGAIWNWYSFSCGGIFEGSGDTVIVYPSMNMEYFVRAENICNTTSCISIYVNSGLKVFQGFDTSICIGGNAVLSASYSGIAPDSILWYEVGFSNTLIGTGQTIVVSPTQSSFYQVVAYWNTTCTGNYSSDVKFVQVNKLPLVPALVNASPDTICSNSNSILSAYSMSNIISWWDSPNGGNILGTGANYMVSPSITSTYFAEADTIIIDSLHFGYIGSVQKWTVPSGITSIMIDAYGAQGGLTYNNTGGLGGRVQTNLSVTPGHVLNFSVGAEGSYYQSWGLGGWNGGGNGGNYGGAGGGGATDVRIGGTSLTDRVIVAGGGGGSGGSGGAKVIKSGGSGSRQPTQSYSNNNGGPGGDILGGNGSYYSGFDSLYCGKGGTQTSGGVAAHSAFSGTFGDGGDANQLSAGGAGGGGYFGGGGGNGTFYYGGGGGGGSNYVNNIFTSNSYSTQGYNSGNGFIIVSYTKQSTCSNSRIPVTVYINSQNQTADSILSTSSICSGTSMTLIPSGGNIYSGGWYWYSGSCGGTFVGSSLSAGIIVNPSTNIVYYLRAEGTCNTTVCVSKTIVININSLPADSINTTQSSICSGSSATLGFSGGILGTGANWSWYSGNCGGTFEGSGLSIIISSTVNTVYYLRAEGICNSTTCVTASIIVNYMPGTPTSTNAYPGTVNVGQNSMLVVNGTLSSGDYWKWYENSCGSAIAVGTGNSITITPYSTTTYYVRTEIGACYSNCLSIIVIVNNLNNPVSSNASPDTLCYGLSTNLSVVGILNGGQWYWYSTSCGGTLVGTGTPVSVTPTSTSLYYVRQEYYTNYSTCVSKTVIVNTFSTQASVAFATPSLICPGNSTTVSLTGGILGPNAQWYWYSSSCGGFTEGTGIYVVKSPVQDTTYYVRAESSCNTTLCSSVYITVNTPSTSPGSASASPAAICVGATSSLSFMGGVLGKGATWYWYSNSCGGTFEGTGTTIYVNPTTTTSYYIRAEGNCNTTNCANISIVIYSYSSSATLATTSNDTICQGTVITLGITGGTLGIPATWYWYSGSCGGTTVGNGTPLMLIPTNTTVYYVRAEGICNTTSCVSVSVAVNDDSSPVDSVNISIPVMCPGSSASLSISGGSLGAGAGWYWYSGSCGGVSAGNGTSLTVSPSLTTDYYVRAEGTCNSTICISKTATIYINSSQAGSINASSSSICTGGSVTLGLTGGILGDGAEWYWYSGSCGGTNEGSGIAIVVSPTIVSAYYLRAIGICNTTTCVSIAITINTISIPADSAMTTMSLICPGSSTSLSISGGSLGTGGSWYWYNVSCGGVSAGNGTLLTVSPTTTTDYYVRAECTCNTTTCVSITIYVNNNSLPADSLTATQTIICAGNSITLGISGGNLGTSAEWYWYIGSCGGTIAGSGLSIIVSPLNTTDYYARDEGICNTTACVVKVITVNPLPIPVISSNSPVCYGDTLKLYSGGGNLYSWTGPDTNTSSLQNPVYPDFISGGEYYVTITTNAGCTATDSINVALQPMSTLQGKLKYSGGNLNSINATIELYKREDTLFNFYDSVAYISSYTFNNLQPGNYILKATIHGTQFPHIMPSYFDSAYKWKNADTIIIPCNSNITKDIKMYEITPLTGGNGLISGNIWYLVPGTKTIGEPVPGAEVILSQEPGDDPISYTQTDTSGFYGFDSIPNGTYSLIVDIPGYQLKSTYPISVTPFNLTFLHRNFLVDTSDTGRGIYREGGTGITPDKFTDFSLVVYPNPYKDRIYINYNLFKTSNVNIEVMDMLGRKLETIVNSNQKEGEYSLIFDGNREGLESDIYIIKFIVNNKFYIKKIIKSN